MIEKFDSYEKASMFVERKRREGYQADILNESVGFLWGPRTVGGFRVQVSDEVVDPEILKASQEREDSLLTRSARYLFLLILFVGIGVGVISAITAFGATLELAFGILVIAVMSIGGGYLIFRNDFPRN